MFVDHEAVLDAQAGRSGEFDIGQDAYAHHGHIGQQGPVGAAETDAFGLAFNRQDRGATADLGPLALMQGPRPVGDRRRHAPGEQAVRRFEDRDAAAAAA